MCADTHLPSLTLSFLFRSAGGLRYVRYGSLHGNVLGMEMVLANGTVVDNLSTLRKDNTGYDLKQLFIGAEGTLGVVTKVAILAPRKPKSQLVAFLACASYQSVLATMQLARASLLEIVSAIEFLDRGSLALVLKHLPGARDPLEKEHPFYMLIETSGSDAEHDGAKLSAFLEKAMEAGLVLDGTVADDTTAIRSLWALREGVAEALAKDGKGVYKYDISLPVAGMYELVLQIKARLATATEQGKVNGVVGYGHLGDGNLHLNVHADKLNPEVLKLIEPYIFEQTGQGRSSSSCQEQEAGRGCSLAHILVFSVCVSFRLCSRRAWQCVRGARVGCVQGGVHRHVEVAGDDSTHAASAPALRPQTHPQPVQSATGCAGNCQGGIRDREGRHLYACCLLLLRALVSCFGFLLMISHALPL